jgi:hypothetical protein
MRSVCILHSAFCIQVERFFSNLLGRAEGRGKIGGWERMASAFLPLPRLHAKKAAVHRHPDACAVLPGKRMRLLDGVPLLRHGHLRPTGHDADLELTVVVAPRNQYVARGRRLLGHDAPLVEGTSLTVPFLPSKCLVPRVNPDALEPAAKRRVTGSSSASAR